MAQANTTNRYAGKIMIHDVTVTDIQKAMNNADSSCYIRYPIADIIHSALEYQLLERIENRIGRGRCYEDNSYYEGVLDALKTAKVVTPEQTKAVTNIKKAWWDRISARIEEEG